VSCPVPVGIFTDSRVGVLVVEVHPAILSPTSLI
jgi:hypothetical protein